MAKLAASLFRKNNDVNKPDDVTNHVIKANERQARASKGNFHDTPNLPTLGNKSNGKPPSGYSPRPIAASPSKSVSFKLEPENKDAIMTKRGGARWGVAFSSNQDRRTYNTADRVFQPSDGRASRTLDRKLHYGQHKLERAPTESHPSTALLRPRADGGITGISGIHLMADPYRRYLMARAVDQSEKYRGKTKTGEEHGRKSLQSDINSNSHFGGDSRFGNRRNFHQALPSLKQGR
uniref:Uncharacterized protein n=1 Tax=Ciona savignyi TaxID=51511 RepID=H2ZLX4_CIOSA